ncbi:MAG: DNA polymerase IV [Ilumatobacteraceae bacterium]|nr:DNA polymerase IV [Acidimicrobiales bacterium]MCB9394158.1 DNA polymerase IV [Acidimicrobiaceae bacterium]
MGVGPHILHADLDAFYASVEQLLDPSLRGRPIAVGGSVVLAASYEAKRFGVQGGMSGRQAKQRCPDLVFVGGHFREYQRLADRVMEVLSDHTPHVERISIDEAFCDVGGSVHLFGPPGVIAARIRARVRDEIGLPISVGAARTKHLAKIASQVAKPDGLVVVDPDRELEFLHPLPVGLVWGVGPVTERTLADRGIHTIGQLAATGDEALQRLLGTAIGSKVFALAANDDARRVESGARARSVGAQSAFGRREPTPDLVRSVLGHLADRVAGRLRAKQRAGRTVTVRVRFAARGRPSTAVTRSSTSDAAIATTLTLTEVAERLVHRALADHPECREISLLAISVSNLVDQPVLQLELPVDAHDHELRPGSRVGSARWAVDTQIDAIRRKFGRSAVGYTSTALSDAVSVPDEFRELAEHEL